MSHTWHTSYFLNRQYVPILVNCRHHTTNGRCKKSFYFLHRPFVHAHKLFVCIARTDDAKRKETFCTVCVRRTNGRCKKWRRLFAWSVFVARTDDAKRDFLHGQRSSHERTYNAKSKRLFARTYVCTYGEYSYKIEVFRSGDLKGRACSWQLTETKPCKKE